MTNFKSLAPMKPVLRVARATKFLVQGDSNRFRY